FFPELQTFFMTHFSMNLMQHPHIAKWICKNCVGNTVTGELCHRLNFPASSIHRFFISTADVFDHDVKPDGYGMLRVRRLQFKLRVLVQHMETYPVETENHFIFTLREIGYL